jgi:hypothetical protein
MGEVGMMNLGCWLEAHDVELRAMWAKRLRRWRVRLTRVGDSAPTVELVGLDFELVLGRAMKEYEERRTSERTA